MKEKRRQYLTLFLTMLKIGAFTFGGGYAMIALIEEEMINRKKWMEREEFLDVVAIAEATPGPLAINCATYIGYKIAAVPGAIFSTLAICLPAFTIIYLISLFFNVFLSLRLVACAFRGIQVGIILLILRAGVGMLKKMERSVVSFFLFGVTMVGMILGTLHIVKITSVVYILFGGVIGYLIFLFAWLRERKEDNRK